MSDRTMARCRVHNVSFVVTDDLGAHVDCEWEALQAALSERDAARALNADAARAIRVLLGGGVSYCPGDMVRLCDKLEGE